MVLVPAVLIFLFIQLFRQIKIFKQTSILAKLTESGIEFFEDHYSGIGLVPWDALKGYNEQNKTLCIYAKNSNPYINKISNTRVRNKAIKKSIGNSLLFTLNLTIIDCDEVELKRILFKKIEDISYREIPVIEKI